MTVYEWGVRWDDNTEEWHGGKEHVARARAREYRGRLIRRPLAEVVDDFRTLPARQSLAATDPALSTATSENSVRSAVDGNAPSPTRSDAGE